MNQSGSGEAVLKDVDEGEFRALQADGGVEIIDVRTPDEYQAGHIAGARMIDIYEPSFPDEVAKLERDRTYLLYCRSGSRSAHAAQYMQQLGFARLYNLADGLMGWTGELTQ